MPRAFVNHLIDLVSQEREAALNSERKALLGHPLDMAKKGIAILNLRELANEKEPKRKRWNIVLEPITSKLPKHKIIAGDKVQIQGYGSMFDPHDEETTGIISEITLTTIHILTINEISITDSCNIAKFPTDETFKRMSEALKKLNSRLGVSIENNDYFSSLFFPRIRPLDEVKFIDQDLDRSQIEAVAFSIGPNKISLIHGPPGKTHTLIEIIRQLVENQKLRLLVCAPSNVAVDNVLRRIMKYEHINTLRVGNIARISSDLHSRTVEELSDDKFEYTKDSLTIRPGTDTLSKLIASLSLEELASRSIEKTCFQQGKSPAVLLKEADVVFCTLNGSGCVMMEDENFDVAIIDEAGQATEPDCWIALLKAKKAILCGDHLQLPPTVISQPDSINDPRPKGLSTLNDLSYTMFDRLTDMHGEKIIRTLTMQYRMHKEIMKFSSQELYDNKLVAHKSVAGHLLIDLPGVNICESTKYPLMLIDTRDWNVFHETQRRKNSAERSFSNDMEVALVEKHIEILMEQGGLKEAQIGVITPYAAQVFSLQDVINKRWKDIEINSIDGYQGREKECIIISMVRSNKEGNVGFLSDKRRLNVAMTRARRQLVVIGDTRTLLHKGPRISLSSPLSREFLINWIRWLNKKSNKQLSQRYLSF